MRDISVVCTTSSEPHSPASSPVRLFCTRRPSGLAPFPALSPSGEGSHFCLPAFRPVCLCRLQSHLQSVPVRQAKQGKSMAFLLALAVSSRPRIVVPQQGIQDLGDGEDHRFPALSGALAGSTRRRQRGWRQARPWRGGTAESPRGRGVGRLFAGGIRGSMPEGGRQGRCEPPGEGIGLG